MPVVQATGVPVLPLLELLVPPELLPLPEELVTPQAVAQLLVSQLPRTFAAELHAALMSGWQPLTSPEL